MEFIKDDIKFKIIGKQLIRDRIHIKIESTDINNNIQEFTIYRSHSEGGFLRLCICCMYNAYVKGSDYITVTFIDMELQNFINTIEDKIPVRDDIKCLSINVLPDIEYEERFVKDEILDTLQFCPNSNCFRSNFISQYEMLKNGTKYQRYMHKLLLKTIPENDRRISVFGNNSIEVYKDLMNIISEYMETFFIVKSLPIYIGTYRHTGLGIPIVHNFYKINMENLMNGIIYQLIYSEYVYLGKTYKCIVNMVPTEAKINKYGLYTNICKAGVYIYKIIEYTIQCSFISDLARKCTDNYTFIGDIIDNIYPLNKLENVSVDNLMIKNTDIQNIKIYCDTNNNSYLKELSFYALQLFEKYKYIKDNVI